MAPGEHFNFRQLQLVLLRLLHQGRQQVSGTFHRRDPAGQAVTGQFFEGKGVVHVQRRAADELDALAAQVMHGGHIIGLDLDLAVIAQPPQARQLRRRLDQRQSGQHHLGPAGLAHIAGQPDPVIQRQRAALGADGFAQVDHIQRLLTHIGVEIHDLLAWPVEQDWTQGQFHIVHSYCQAR